MSDLLATKPLDLLLAEAQDESGTSLRRVLGPVNLITLGIGAIIGAGIFVITGQAAAQDNLLPTALAQPRQPTAPSANAAAANNPAESHVTRDEVRS